MTTSLRPTPFRCALLLALIGVPLLAASEFPLSAPEPAILTTPAPAKSAPASPVVAPPGVSSPATPPPQQAPALTSASSVEAAPVVEPALSSHEAPCSHESTAATGDAAPNTDLPFAETREAALPAAPIQAPAPPEASGLQPVAGEPFADPPAAAPAPAVAAEASPPPAAAAAAPATLSQEEILATAVALNYCRASFHRIRKNQTPEILLEEQEKILNNLNLGRVDDPEVIALYTSVLDEINQIGVADKERDMYQKHHSSSVRRQITWDAVAFGTDLMTAQFGNAVKTGANSWWDYRNKVFNRDVEIHKIDKNRVTSVMQRSSQFLDTFWKLARKKNIPDRYLVRGDDLDQLETAMQEHDPAVRLRVLRRMEPFMEAYPPYWYYVARTQQELGHLTEAMDVYHRLERIGQGHFRKDELLATAMANQAAILDYLGRETAVAAARKSLSYATDVWEANLMSARILQRHGQVDEAEDAILRNLDVDLEQTQSHVFLASLYYFAHDTGKLAGMLNNPKAVAHLPAPVLLRCAAVVGLERTPPVVVNTILASLEAFPRAAYNDPATTVRVGHAWQLHLARIEAYQDNVKLANPQVLAGKGFHDLRFAGQSPERGFPFVPASSSAAVRELRLDLTYPDGTVVKLTLLPAGARTGERSGMPNLALSSTPPSLRIASVRIGEETLTLRVREASVEVIDAARPLSEPPAAPSPISFPSGPQPQNS